MCEVNVFGLFDTKDDLIVGRVSALETSVVALKAEQELSRNECQTKHEQHTQYRAETQSKMDALIKSQDSTNDTLSKILAIMEDNSPVIDRSKNNYTTFDTLKGWGASVTVLTTAVVSVYGVIHLIKTIFG